MLSVLTLPLDKRKAGAAFEGAIAEAARRLPARMAPLSVEPFPAPAADSGAPAGPGARSRTMVWGAAAAVVAAMAVTTFLLLHKSHDAGKPAAVASTGATSEARQKPRAEDAALVASPVVETSIVKGKVDELLEKARLAMRERRYSEPPGDNALLYYRSAAAADPTNGEAIDGLQRVAGVLASRFEEAMSGARFDEAALSLANLKAAAPTDERVPSLELRLTTSQITRAFADGNVEKAAALVRLAQQSASIPADQIAKWRVEIARRQEDAKIQRFASLVSDRIRDGRLVEPAEDSAKTYLQQLHEAAPTNSTTQRLTRELNTAYLRKAREAAVANHPADVDHWLSEAKAGGVNAAELSSFQRELASARQRAVLAEIERLAQLSRDRLREGHLNDSAQDSAAYYVGQLQAADATNAAVPQLSRELAARFLDRAHSEIQAGKGSLADADLAQARRWGADPKDIAAAQQSENAPKAAAASAAARSAAATSGLSSAQLASSLKRVRYTAPEYPANALQQGLSGAVTVEYTVDVNGDPRDTRVIEATPPGVFDHAAMAAVKHWHYQPVVVNGTQVEIPVRTVIRFQLPK